MTAHDGDARQEHFSDSADPVREEVVQRLLHGFESRPGPAAMSAFIGLEFTQTPTDAERAEAHRRYVQELVDHATRTGHHPPPKQ